MATTLSDLRTQCYELLREEENSSAYSYTIVDQMINSAQLRICTGACINPLTKEMVAKGDLPFINTDYFYSSVGDITLTADATVWATSLSATTTNFASSGKLYIAGNIITYTWKTASTFTWVTGVLFAFKSGERVSQAFTLPTDFASIKNVTYNNNYRMESKEFDDIFEELNKLKGRNYGTSEYNPDYNNTNLLPTFYTIKDGTYLIIFNVNNTGDMIRLRYEKLPTTMSATTDTATISNDIYAKGTILYLAVGELLYNRWEEGRAGELLNFAYGQLREMFKFYNNASYESLNWKQYKCWKWRLNI